MNRRSAFTFIEMLVAMSIAVGLMLFVNQIVSHSVGAVRLGESASQVIESSRMISDQVTRDIEAMLPPSKGGFLIILNKAYTTSVLKTDDSTKPTIVHSDQLLFIRSKGRLEPLCPSNDNSFAFDSSAAESAGYVRMWYGHCQITEPNGSSPAGDQLGQAGPNEYAANWVLGRQALFLVDSSLYPGGATAWGTHRAENARTTAATTGATLNGQQASNSLYHGTTDVADETLESINAALHSGGAVNTTNALAYAFTTERLHVNLNAPADNSAALFAQGHAAFVENVSQFSVQFAGDYDGDGRIDTDTTTNAIVWYGIQDDGTTVLNPPNMTPSAAGTLHDSAYVFSATQPTMWPRMLRLRFRLHDKRSILSDLDGKAGRSYELIIPIKN